MTATIPLPLTGRADAEVPPPPFALPGEHFAAALVWFALGSVALPFVAGSLAMGGFLQPAAIAVTHCFTLGWITTSIFGVLYQIFPVALGVAARSARLGHLTFWTLQAGIVSLVCGSWHWWPVLLGAGWVLLVLALAGLAANLLPGLRGAPRGRTIGRYVAGALAGLAGALAVIAARIGNALGWWQVDRLGILTAHVHLAAVGFATLMAVGVGSRLLPMFLLSHDHPVSPLRWIGPVAGVGLVALAGGALRRAPLLYDAGGLLLLAAMAGYLYLAGEYFRHRVRRSLDPGMAHAAVAHGYLAIASLLGIALMLSPGLEPRLVAAYAVAGILGWLSLLIVGLYYKIVPFLTWLHRFGSRVGRPGVPRVADLVLPRLAWAGLVLLGVGVAGLGAGIATGQVAAARAGALLFAAGAGLTVAQYARLGLAR